VLRDPVERAHSNWTHLWSAGLDPIDDFVRACQAEDARVAAGWAEAGGTATDLKGGPLGGLTCNLETRTTLLCSPTAERHAAALKAVASSR